MLLSQVENLVPGCNCFGGKGGMLCENLNQQTTLTFMLSRGVGTSVLIITAAVGLQVLYEMSLYLVCLVRVPQRVLGKVHLWTHTHTHWLPFSFYCPAVRAYQGWSHPTHALYPLYCHCLSGE